MTEFAQPHQINTRGKANRNAAVTAALVVVALQWQKCSWWQ